MLKINDPLPHFIAKDQSGETVNSKELLGKKLILFFYPKANTPGCTAEACDLNAHLQQLKDLGYTLMGISPDPVKNLLKFSDKFSFGYPLLSDEAHAIAEAFGVWQLKKFMGREYMGVVRTTFLFDENGICTHVIEKVDTKNAATQILSLL